ESLAVQRHDLLAVCDRAQQRRATTCDSAEAAGGRRSCRPAGWTEPGRPGRAVACHGTRTRTGARRHLREDLIGRSASRQTARHESGLKWRPSVASRRWRCWEIRRRACEHAEAKNIRHEDTKVTKSNHEQFSYASRLRGQALGTSGADNCDSVRAQRTAVGAGVVGNSPQSSLSKQSPNIRHEDTKVTKSNHEQSSYASSLRTH